MKNFKECLKNSFSFTKEYAPQYFRLLLKPIIFTCIGLLFVGLTTVNALFAIPALFVSIPCICYAFWNGYIITYSLNNAANGFFDAEHEKLKDLLINEEQKKQLALYLAFCALITLIIYLPSILYLIKTIDFTALMNNSTEYLSNTKEVLHIYLAFMLNTAILLPFLNFFNQALYYKKENENFFNSFFNCYKYINFTGILLSTIFTIIGCIINYANILYPIIALFLNLIFFSANAFWFKSRVEIENK